MSLLNDFMTETRIKKDAPNHKMPNAIVQLCNSPMAMLATASDAAAKMMAPLIIGCVGGGV